LISFCTSSLTSPGLRSSTPAMMASRRCRFWRRITSGLNTGSMVATWSSAIGVPSGKGHRQLGHLVDAFALAFGRRSTTSTWSPSGVVQ
jgi:hypothetical protein